MEPWNTQRDFKLSSHLVSMYKDLLGPATILVANKQIESVLVAENNQVRKLMSCAFSTSICFLIQLYL